MLGFGITAKVDQDAIADMFKTVLPDAKQQDLETMGVDISGIIASNSTYMIVLGVIVVVVAIFGFVGACCMVRWMLVVVS